MPSCSHLYDIHPFTVGVGLETDRARALSSLPRQIAFSSVWQQYEFAVFEELDEDTEIAELIPRRSSQNSICLKSRTAWTRPSSSSATSPAG
jgi:hypothetical protein